ncbi:unnamed protein product, partial [Chrysoparadoxa australica]
QDYAAYYFPHRDSGGADTTMSANGELLLRVIAEFWLNQNTVLEPSTPASALRERAPSLQPTLSLSHSLSHSQSQEAVVRDPSECEWVGDYQPPADMAMHGLLVVVGHLLADPALAKLSARAATGIGLAHKGGISAMSPALAALQPHMMAFLRITINNLHINATAWLLAVELWLLWLAPWKAASVMAGKPPSA